MVEGKDVKCTLITFEPGCINSYHIHHGSEQTIICVGGRGWYQEEGKELSEMRPGDAIAIPTRNKTLAWSSKRQLVLSYCCLFSRCRFSRGMV